MSALKRIALTGGIACGKSLAAEYLNQLGVETLDADDVVHGLLPDPAERRRLAAEVFADPAKRRALEARLHPQVKARIDEFFAAPAATGRPPLRLAIVPLLYEVHWEAGFDLVVCISSTREHQLARMMETRGYTRAQAEARLAAQLPVAEKAARADFVLENDGSAEDLRTRVAELHAWLLRV